MSDMQAKQVSSFRIKCVNTEKSNIFKCVKPELDKVWYNDTQRSFLEPVRDSNLLARHLSKVELRREVASRRAKDPDSYVHEFSVVMNLKKTSECIHSHFKELNECEEPAKLGCRWESDTEEESDTEDQYETDSMGAEQLLKDIPDSVSEMSNSENHISCLEREDRLDDKLYADFMKLTLSEESDSENRLTPAMKPDASCSWKTEPPGEPVQMKRLT